MSSNNDYKDTLNLPNTAFAMKANLPQREPELIQKWQEAEIYQKIRDWAKGREKFILHDGPPYANGNIHLGHAANKILKDIIIKAKTFSGYDCPYIPGWDCHGLPIEREIEKKKGRAGNKITQQEFRAACRDFAGKQVEKQKEDFQRLGVFGDWQNPYLTMDFKFEANIIRALKDIYEQGHLVKGYKPVHWCTDCHSSLAEAEVEYANKTSPSIDVKFTVVNQDEFLSKFNSTSGSLGEGEVSVLIWTTTPWTLPANEAVALGEDLDYSLVQVVFNDKPERWLVASDLVEQLVEKYDLEFVVLAKTKGLALELLKLNHPFESRLVPIVLGEHVTLDGGTGCVHTAPGHGPDDYLLGVKYGLPVEHQVQANGVFTEHVPFVGNQHVFKANPMIVDILRNNNKLVCFSEINHSYPHCWRHKTPIIFRATPQWFVSMSKQNLRQDALNAIKDVKWIPDWGYARMQKMVEQRPDWCISRQRTWCVPMPLFINKNNKELHPNTAEIIEQVAQEVEKLGVEAWYQLDKDELLKKFDLNDGGVTSYYNYETSYDTLDVWFDSGVTHYTVLKNNPDLKWPADLYLEGSDQHRGWFGSSLMTAVSLFKQAPYKQVLTHGFIVDKNGHKMSKSLGNVISPNDVNNKWGADILRLWVAGADYRGEIVISEEIFKRTADIYRRIRNTARFLLSNLNGFDPNQDLVDYHSLIKLDAWAVQRAVSLQEEIIADYNNYNFRSASMKIHDFCAIDMGSFYLDIIKDRQYTTKKDSLPRRSAQTAMYYIIQMLSKWMAPILCFTAEEIWQNIPRMAAELEANAVKKSDSIFLSLYSDNVIKGIKYNELLATAHEAEFGLDYWQQVINIKTAINKQIESLRAEGLIGSSLQAEVQIFANDPYYSILNKLEEELRFVLITSKAKVAKFEQIVDNHDLVATDMEDIKVKVKPSTETKCIRCWHYSESVGSNTKYSELCDRCITNIACAGETRMYA